MLRLIVVLAPLALDSFAVAAVAAIAGVPAGGRLRVATLLTACETTMPLVGLLLGAALGRVVGRAAEVVAVVALGAAAIYLLAGGGEDAEAARLQRLAAAPGSDLLALAGLAFAVGADELAIGVGAGLAGVPLLPALVLIAIQGFVAAQLGLRLGARAGERAAEGAERLAGVCLAAIAVLVAVEAFR